MAELTLEQQKAVALAKARLRVKEKNEPTFLGTVNDYGKSFLAGVGRGVTGALDLAGTSVSPIQAVRRGMANAGLANDVGVAPTATETVRDLTDGGLDYRGDSFGERVAGTTGEFLPMAFATGPSGPGQALAYSLAPALGAEVATEVVGDAKVPESIPFIGGAPIEPAARVAGSLAGGVAAGMTGDAIRTAAARKDYIKTSPSSQKLVEDAGKLYEQGHSLNIKVKPEGTQALTDGLRNIARERGFITPAGNVSRSVPEVRAVLNDLDDYLAGPITTRQLMALKAQLQTVAESQTKKVSSTGVQMIKMFDEFMDGVAPQFRAANELYTRAMRGEMMDTVDDLADIKASNFTGSGRENALRSEFRALDRKITKGKVKGLRPDQAQAVKNVSRGTAASNTARAIGKAAPTGVVSSGLSGGVPFLVGNAIGGPAIGGLAAGTSMGMGVLGRTAATSLQERAAAMASAAMRSPEAFLKPEAGLPAGLSAILAAVAAETIKDREEKAAAERTKKGRQQ